MKLLLGILLLIGLALLATSAKFLKLRRSTLVGVLVSGGWLGVMTGMIIGPGALNLVSPAIILESSPLLMIGLGWIGLMIGLQLRRDILKRLPQSLIRLTAADVIGSLIFFGAAATLAMSLWLPSDVPAAMLAPVVLLGSAGIGWTAEMRSLRLANSANAENALILRGATGLGAPVAILIFSIGVAGVHGMDAAHLEVDFASSLLRVGALILIAIALGVIARFGLRRADGNRSEILAVFLGVVALVAGAAAELGMTPLLSAMLVGIVIANLAGKELRQFERFILEAEHAVATIFWIVAGVLIDIRIGWIGLSLVVALVALRILMKPLLVRISGLKGAPASEHGSERLLRFAPIRQSPVAITLAVALVISIPSDLNHKLLTVVALVGILSDAFVMFVGRAERSDRELATDSGVAPREALA